MKIIKLLIIVSLTAVMAYFGYQLTASDEDSKPEKIAGKSVSPQRTQPQLIEEKPQNTPPQQANNDNKLNAAVAQIDVNSSALTPPRREDGKYSRLAPPPPLTANETRDNRHSDKKGHGHEHAPISRTRNNNPPAPPIGANN